MLERNNPTRKLLLVFLGLCVSIIPVAVTIFSYFPIWVSRDDTSILSGISLLLLCAALVPFYKYLLRVLRSPSAPIMWLILFVLFSLLSRIADEMTVISFVGFVTNLVGSLFFKLARSDTRKENNDERGS